MGTETLIKLLVSLLGEYLIKPETAAKYAKYLLRGRDYLLLLFPVDKYPEGDYKGTTIARRDASTFAVPVSAVPEAIRKGKRD
jgi:hypothetical protein